MWPLSLRNPLAWGTSVCGNFLELCKTDTNEFDFFVVVVIVLNLYSQRLWAARKMKKERKAEWHTPIIPGLGVLRQEDGGLEANLDCIARHCLKRKKRGGGGQRNG